MLSQSPRRAINAVILPAFTTPSPVLTNSLFLSLTKFQRSHFLSHRPSLSFSTVPTVTTMTSTSTSSSDSTSTAANLNAPLPPPAEQPSNLPSKPLLKLPQVIPSSPPLSVLHHSMSLQPYNFWQKFARSLRFFRQLRGRLRKGTVLTAQLSGALSDRASMSARLFSSSAELKFGTLTEALRCAAHDPRIAHLHIRIDTLTCGWAKILELRRHIDLFASSGKSVTAYIETGGPKELFLAMGYGLYVPPQGQLSLRGFATAGTFFKGVLDKVGIDPQVERIGPYKSAGDQLGRTSMAPEQRETLTAILNDINETWTKGVCEATGIERDSLLNLVNEAPWDMQAYVEKKIVTGTCYESELIDALKLKFAKPPSLFNTMKKEDLEKAILSQPLTAIDISRYARRATPRLLGLNGKKRLALIRVTGPITGGKNSSSPVSGPTVGSDTLVQLIRRARDDKRIAGVILRCDSPGGAALASDILWHELRALRAVKPVVASQGDVAASGGYYLSMAAGDIVSEPLTLTGSVGVVASKPSLGGLYERVGYNKENVSVGGKYAQLFVDDRPFTSEEHQYFKHAIRYAYDSFVEKAALSRGKTKDDMDKVAQGRVWTGLQAKEQGLVDHIGGIAKAIEVLKNRCEIPISEAVRVDEITPPMSIAQRLGIAAATVGVTGDALHSGSNTALGAEELLLHGDPLAIADFDIDDGTGVTPLSKLVLDVAIARFTRMAPVLGETQMQNVVSNVMKAMLSQRT